MKTMSLNLRNFPADLHQLLRVEAMQRGMTLQAYVVQLLTEATKKGKTDAR